jgi:hypothetical protein
MAPSAATADPITSVILPAEPAPDAVTPESIREQMVSLGIDSDGNADRPEIAPGVPMPEPVSGVVTGDDPSDVMAPGAGRIPKKGKRAPSK